VEPLLNNYGIQLQFGFYNFLMLTFSVALIAAAGYVINDYFDRKTDIINKPGQVIIGWYINRRFAMFMHVLLNLIAFVLAAYISFQIQIPELSMVFLMVMGILWFYSTTYKRQFLIGNVIVSFFAGLVPLMVLLFEVPALKMHYGAILPLIGADISILLAWVGGFSLFAFFSNLARELIKDAEDYKGDSAYGRNTMPVIWGIENTRMVIMAILALLIAAILFVNLQYIQNLISVLYCLVTLIIPLSYTSYLVWVANSSSGFHKASTGLKIVMIFGVSYAFIAYFFILN
jgi:4-hydroxybenzoate polyprenyltransferase